MNNYQTTSFKVVLLGESGKGELKKDKVLEKLAYYRDI
jgi:hypothetical protein